MHCEIDSPRKHELQTISVFHYQGKGLTPETGISGFGSSSPTRK
jgi:hypothetical protein